MKKFNTVITVEVSVDSIAQQLLSVMSPDAKHREIITEAIIATGIEKSTLSFVYNALNGFLPTIDFKVGDLVVCSAYEYMYKTEESREKRSSRSEELGDCRVVAINEYASCKLQVEYTYYNQDGTTKPATKWVKHTDCSHIPLPAVIPTVIAQP